MSSCDHASVKEQNAVVIEGPSVLSDCGTTMLTGRHDASSPHGAIHRELYAGPTGPLNMLGWRSPHRP